MTAAGLLVVLNLTLMAGGTGADGHLLAGARLFREARYAEALVEFQVAHRLGSTEAAQYAAVALVKLGRPEEALEAFGRLDAQGADALVDYHRALAAFDARLYLASDRLLAGVADRAGPRIGEQVSKMRADIATVLSNAPTSEAIDWYLDRCRAERAAGRTALAPAFCREAASLAERRSDRYRHDEALQGAAGPTRSGTP